MKHQFKPEEVRETVGWKAGSIGNYEVEVEVNVQSDA